MCRRIQKYTTHFSLWTRSVSDTQSMLTSRRKIGRHLRNLYFSVFFYLLLLPSSSSRDDSQRMGVNCFSIVININHSLWLLRWWLWLVTLWLMITRQMAWLFAESRALVFFILFSFTSNARAIFGTSPPMSGIQIHNYEIRACHRIIIKKRTEWSRKPRRLCNDAVSERRRGEYGEEHVTILFHYYYYDLYTSNFGCSDLR